MTANAPGPDFKLHPDGPVFARGLRAFEIGFGAAFGVAIGAIGGLVLALVLLRAWDDQLFNMLFQILA